VCTGKYDKLNYRTATCEAGRGGDISSGRSSHAKKRGIGSKRGKGQGGGGGKTIPNSSTLPRKCKTWQTMEGRIVLRKTSKGGVKQALQKETGRGNEKKRAIHVLGVPKGGGSKK